MKRLAVMMMFLTRIPVRVKSEIAYEDYVKGVVWTPLIALIIGVPVFLFGYLKDFISPYVFSFLVLMLYLLLSGGLHIDGLADTMDAFGSNRGKQRTLEILKDVQMGTFGVLSIVLYCFGMVILLPNVPQYTLLLFPLIGRATALLCARTHDYARTEGLGKSFSEGAKLWHVGLSLILYFGLAVLIIGNINLIIVLITVGPLLLSPLFTWILVHHMSKKIGGITGDLIGYSIEVSTLLYLLITYAVQAVLIATVFS